MTNNASPATPQKPPSASKSKRIGGSASMLASPLQNAAAVPGDLPPEPDTAIDVPPIVIPPEWSEQELQSEKWAAKTTFEDPEGLGRLPPSLASLVASYERASVLIDGDDIVVVDTVTPHEDFFKASLDSSNLQNVCPIYGDGDVEVSPHAGAETTPINAGVTADLPPHDDSSIIQTCVKWSHFAQANFHLMHSPLMREILGAIHIGSDVSKMFKLNGATDEFSPYEHIYPKGKDGLPVISASGKYFVRLFWLGAWRRVTIDDRIPLDANKRPLLISSPLKNELWPLLLSKALLKLAMASLNEQNAGREHGDFVPLRALTGWFPESVALNLDANMSLLTSWSLKVSPQMLDVKHRLFTTPASPTKSSSAHTQNQGNAPASAATIIKEAPMAVILATTDDTDRPTFYRIVDYRLGDDDILPEEPHEDSPPMIRVSAYIGSPWSFEDSVEDDDSPDSQWLTFDDFLQAFQSVVVYQNPSDLKSKTIAYNPESAQDLYNRTYLLSWPQDGSKERIIKLAFETYGPIKLQRPASRAIVYVEPYSWSTIKMALPLILTRTNGFCALNISSSLAGPEQRLLRVVIDASNAYSVTAFSTDDYTFERESHAALANLLPQTGIRDFEDTHQAVAAGTWHTLFKQVIKVSQPTLMAAQLYLNEAARHYSTLHLFDLDTKSEIPLPLADPRPVELVPKEKGYVLFAECRPPQNITASKFRLRLLSDPPVADWGAIDLSVKPNVTDMEEMYYVNRHSILFRLLLRSREAAENLASFQMTYSEHKAIVRLQVLDYDVELGSVEGAGVLSLPVIPLAKDDEVPPPAGKGHKGQPPPPSKHRYIVQGTLVYKSRNLMEDMAASEATRPSTPAQVSRPTTGAKSASKEQRKTDGTFWKLRVISSSNATVVLAKDTEKEDKLKAMKESWEQSKPGRAAKSRDARDQYLKNVLEIQKALAVTRERMAAVVPSKELTAILGYPPSQDGQPVCLVPEDVAAREDMRTKRMVAFAERMDQVRKDRVAAKEHRQRYKAKQLQLIDDFFKQVEQQIQDHNQQRLTFRKVIDDGKAAGRK